MSDQRNIRTGRSAHTSGTGRKIQRTGSAAHAQGQPRRSTAAGSRPAGARPQPRTGTARQVNTSTAQRPRPAQGSGQPPRRRKHHRHLRWWVKPMLVVCVLGIVFGSVLGYAHNFLHAIGSGVEGTQMDEEVQTAPEFKGDVVNILLLGMDFEEGRGSKIGKNGERIGNTDMIMYVNYDLANNRMNMLQIPRDTFVGKTVTCDSTTGRTYKAGAGKINSLVFSNDEEYSALADVIAHQFKLPVDYYAAINMDALVEMVDLYGGLDVYVPQDIKDDYGNVLQQGYRHLDGATVSFLVRQRHAYANQDLGRLNTQRYFYAALFQRVREATVKDIVKLMPVVKKYVTTNIPLKDMISLATNFLNIDPGNIIIAQAPMHASSQMLDPNPEKGFKGYSILIPAREELAALLNQYFRAHTGPVPPEQLVLRDDWPHHDAVTDSNVQAMGQKSEADAAA